MDTEELESIDSPKMDEISEPNDNIESTSTSPHREALDDLLGGRAYHFMDGIANAKALLNGLSDKVEIS